MTEGSYGLSVGCKDLKEDEDGWRTGCQEMVEQDACPTLPPSPQYDGAFSTKMGGSKVE